MSNTLLDFLRRHPNKALLVILCLLREGNLADLADELEVFLTCYPSGATESAIFFLPEFEMSNRLSEVLQRNPGLELVELGMGLRYRGDNQLAAELSNLIENFPGMETTDALLPGKLSFSQKTGVPSRHTT